MNECEIKHNKNAYEREFDIYKGTAHEIEMWRYFVVHLCRFYQVTNNLCYRITVIYFNAFY